MKKDITGVNGYIMGYVGMYAILLILGFCFYAAYQAPTSAEILAAQEKAQAAEK